MSVDSALKTETLFPLSQHPSGSNSRVHPSGSNSRVGQNFRVATGAGVANEAAAPKRSSELAEERDFRVAGSAGTSNKFAPSRRSSNPDYSTIDGQADWNVRVAGSAGTSHKFAPRRSSNLSVDGDIRCQLTVL